MLALDPGLAKCGWAVVELGRYPEDDKPLAGGVIVTDRSEAAESKVADTVRRVHELGDELTHIRRQHGPFVATCAECFSPPRSSIVAGQMGHAWGVIVEQTRAAAEYLLQCTPQEVKLSTVGTNNASKAEVIAFVTNRWGDAVGRILSPLKPGLYEHAADALAVQVTCADSDVVHLAR